MALDMPRKNVERQSIDALKRLVRLSHFLSLRMLQQQSEDFQLREENSFP
jgi:hypothetical protein